MFGFDNGKINVPVDVPIPTSNDIIFQLLTCGVPAGCKIKPVLRSFSGKERFVSRADKGRFIRDTFQELEDSELIDQSESEQENSKIDKPSMPKPNTGNFIRELDPDPERRTK